MEQLHSDAGPPRPSNAEVGLPDETTLGDGEMASESYTGAIHRVPIAPPTDRRAYRQYRIDQALSYLPKDASDEAKRVVIDTVDTRLDQYGIRIED